MIPIHVFVFKMHTFKIFQILNQYTTRVSLSKAIFPYQFMSSQGQVKGQVKDYNKHGDPLFVFVIFISNHKMILYARNSKY